MAFEWNFVKSGMNQGGPSLSQYGAQGMGGYRPNSSGMEGYHPNTPYQAAPMAPTVDVSQQMAGQQMGDSMALMAEYRENEARIAELEQKLVSVQKEWNDGAAGRQREAANDLDMQLARARAKYGDFGSAYNHLNRIDVREQAALNKDANAFTQKDADRKNLRDAYIMMAEASPAGQAAWKGAIADMEAAYERKYGEKFEGLSIPTGNVNGGVSNWDQFENLFLQKKNSKGNLSQADIDLMKSTLSTMPQGDKYNEWMDKLDGLKSQEKIDADKKAYLKKVNDGLAELDRDWGNQKIRKDLKKPGDKTTRVKNGITFTITYTGMSPSGKKQYEISVNGKKQKTREE